MRNGLNGLNGLTVLKIPGSAGSEQAKKGPRARGVGSVLGTLNVEDGIKAITVKCSKIMLYLFTSLRRL